jgi:hypothetical protein
MKTKQTTSWERFVEEKREKKNEFEWSLTVFSFRRNPKGDRGVLGCATTHSWKFDKLFENGWRSWRKTDKNKASDQFGSPCIGWNSYRAAVPRGILQAGRIKFRRFSDWLRTEFVQTFHEFVQKIPDICKVYRIAKNKILVKRASGAGTDHVEEPKETQPELDQRFEDLLGSFWIDF